MAERQSKSKMITYIIPDGEKVPATEIDRLLACFGKEPRTRSDVLPFLRRCAWDCQECGQTFAAIYAAERSFAIASTNDEKVGVLLMMGQILERSREYEDAAKAYAGAFTLPLGTDSIWYLLHNNFGYCLVRLERYKEAEECCPTMYNAHKNLGLALQGQGLPEEAATCFICAMGLTDDPGASRHLEKLV